MSRLVGRYPQRWIRLGNLETTLLADELAALPVREPIFICGLARSGSTLLLEMLAAQAGIASHRYSDFPFLFTPYWWNAGLALRPFRPQEKHERSHGDGIMVNASSPEAMDEMLWMAFFPDQHRNVNQVMDAATIHPAFERFYRDHIKKLLRIRKAQRFVCKGNYHLVRMAYLRKLFPDARFIVPVREPAAHIASLMRQHQRLCDAGQRDARVVRHMNIAGHFEFGLNRITIHTGDDARMREIQNAWERGEEVRGWALYWDMLYGFTHRQLEADPALKQSALLVRFEDIYSTPHDNIRAVLAHCALPQDTDFVERFAAGIRKPDYYPPPFSGAELELIREITRGTAEVYGYD